MLECFLSPHHVLQTIIARVLSVLTQKAGGSYNRVLPNDCRRYCLSELQVHERDTSSSIWTEDHLHATLLSTKWANWSKLLSFLSFLIHQSLFRNKCVARDSDLSIWIVPLVQHHTQVSYSYALEQCVANLELNVRHGNMKCIL